MFFKRYQWLVLWLVVSTSQADIVSIGVMEQSHTDNELFWQETVDYLNLQIPEHNFVLRTLGLECLTHAINKKQLDFAITNPAHILALKKTENVSAIAGLQTFYRDKVYSHYGALLVAKSSRDDLSSLSDLKGQSLIAVSPAEFGGYQMIWRSLLKVGIHPEADLFDLQFSSGSQQNIVKSVLADDADVGIIRSGILEEMFDNNEIKPADIKVIQPSLIQAFEPMHSTILYPEWSIVRLEQTDVSLAKRISVVLKKMPKSLDKSKQYISHYGWGKRQDFTTVHGLLRALKLAPYEPAKKITWQQLVREYGVTILFVVVLLFVLAIAIIYVGRANRKFAKSQLELAEHRDNLEKQVEARTIEISQVNRALEMDIVAREKVEKTLRRSRTALQGFYEISVGTDSQPEKLAKLVQLARRHFAMQAGFLFKISSLSQVNEFEVCTADGQVSLQGEVLNCLTANMELDLFSKSDSVQSCCSNRIICHSVIVEGKSHCVLCLIGEQQTALPEVEQELLRLISQWIGSSIERQYLEEERIKYQRQIEQATRLFTAGELASGLAHEINQPLTAARNYISGSLRRLKEKEFTTVEAGLEKSQQSLDRATSIIRRLREFVQTGTPHQEVFDLITLIKRVQGLLVCEADQQEVSLTISAPFDECLVWGDEVQIEQVVLNLMRNGLDAAPFNGQVDVMLVLKNDRVEFNIYDSGEGVLEKDINTIFDAFNTTKVQGMGLGLAICRSIVEAHQSVLSVENTTDGARFYFELRRECG